MFRATPEHRWGRRIVALSENRFAVIVRGSVTSFCSLLSKHASRTSRKLSSTTNSSASKLMSTMSNKAMKLRRKKTFVGEEIDGGVWRKTILMGGKCEPLDYSGAIYYDHDGKRVSELPRASPLPSYKSSDNNKSRLGGWQAS